MGTRSEVGDRVRSILLGPPIDSRRERQERLGKPSALAVLSSDALSSVAYATEEIVRVLVPVAGIVAFSYVLPISAIIVVLLALLIASYRQTIAAYPTAGGAYVVTKDNFGLRAAQLAGVALLLDYVLTVAVSVSAGVAAVYSAWPPLYTYRVFAAVGVIWVIAWINLRGVRLTGRVFATPTFLFVATMLMLLVVGVARLLGGSLTTLAGRGSPGGGVAGGVALFVLAHAYASGTTALTGVEAISNGISIFRPVEWRNARIVLTWMGVVLAVLFLGIGLLAWRAHPVPTATRTLVSVLARGVFGASPIGTAGFLAVQVMTTMILFFAANTSFSDFPRVTSFQSRDGSLPEPFHRRGRRLVFSTGVVVLATSATIVTVAFGASVTRLIPLYAVGVFTAFTFSQAGMARRHRRVREERWRGGFALNAAGAVGSAAALVTIVVTKFVEGAWIAVVMVAVGFVAVGRVHRHYVGVAGQLAQLSRSPMRHATGLHVLVVVDEHDEGLERAVRYVRSIASVHGVEAIRLGPHDPRLEATFRDRFGTDLRAVGRRWRGELRRSIRAARQLHEDRVVAIVAPELLGSDRPRRSHGRLLRLRRAVWREPGIAFIAIPARPEDPSWIDGKPETHAVVVPVDSADVVALQSVRVAHLIGGEDVRVVHFDEDAEDTERLRSEWDGRPFDVPLEIEPSPFRELTQPVVTIAAKARSEADFVTIVIGELVPRWWQRPLHPSEARDIRTRLLAEPNLALVTVPYAVR